MTEPAFDLKNVSKSYSAGPREISVLKNINLTIQQGDYIAIMGPSGSGKSTLMQLLGCLDQPTEGRLFVLGQEVNALTDDQVSSHRSRSIGFVFQHFNLLPSYDATANVALPLVYTGTGERWARSQQLLDQFGLGHRLHAKPRTLSGGEQQRVALARALVNNPPILLADEPTGSLDQENGRLVLELFEKIHQDGKTVILVTHDQGVAGHARRVVEIVDGRIKRDGQA